ncbi:DUF4199 domain-containing protein [Flavobacterium solisilvae]|uniref:DUF4199 domain-containing protein n=1 Tax=Flavobacterium solisilvae TaxID=1852019 RepID=A0ABX1QU18_9FLAO|nr:DUF4199 domain-containing protein [Flavobacterium solisilvae]NMH24525.1 DUF4199 domain-containing protein [Flavobacterium solisilvae]
MNEIIKRNGIKFGLISGLISVLITVYAYVFDIELFGSLWLLLFIIVCYLVINIVLLSNTKKKLNDNFTFKEAFTTYFICLIVGVSISVIFNILLFNVIDPELGEKVKEVSIKSTVAFMEKFDVPSAEISKAVEGIEKSDNFSIGAQIKGLFTNIAVSSIFGLVFALIFKSKPKEQF